MTEQNLNSMVYYYLERPDLKTNEYRSWIEQEVIHKWIVERERNEPEMLDDMLHWNTQALFFAMLQADKEWKYCKFHMYDGTTDHGRIICFRDHYYEKAVKRVHFIADQFEAFLQEQGIRYERKNTYRNY